MKHQLFFHSMILSCYLAVISSCYCKVTASPIASNHTNSSGNQDCHFLLAEDYPELDEDYHQLQGLRSQAHSIMEQSSKEISYLQNRREELVERTHELNDAIRRVNRQTLTQLATILKEIPEYQNIKQQRQLTMERYMKKEDLPSISEVVQPMLEAATSTIKDWISGATDQVTSHDKLVLSDEVEPLCLNETESFRMIAAQVHSFFSDETSMDYASLQAGSRIVYTNALTSETYSAYDNQQFLQYWNLFLHGVGLPSAIPAPELVLSNTALHAGSCWPIKGKSGKITLQFSSPIHVTNITVEHISPDLEQLVLSDRKRHGSSAPRFFQWIGYPPCADTQNDGNNCHFLGFDLSQPITLNPLFEYKHSSFPLAQTFPAIYQEEEKGETKASIDDENKVAQRNNKLQLGQPEVQPRCSMTSCLASDKSSLTASEFSKSNSKNPSLYVAAMTLIIEDNWGNEDYTCIYRIRVHGKRVEVANYA